MTEQIDKPAALLNPDFNILMLHADKYPEGVRMQVGVPYDKMGDVKALKAFLEKHNSVNQIERIEDKGDGKNSYVYLSLGAFNSLVANFAQTYDDVRLPEFAKHGFAAILEGVQEEYAPTVHMEFYPPTHLEMQRSADAVYKHLEVRDMLDSPPMLRNVGTRMDPKSGSLCDKIQMSYGEYYNIQMLRATECGNPIAAKFLELIGVVGGFDRKAFLNGENPFTHPPLLKLQQAWREGTVNPDPEKTKDTSYLQ